jgi:branched-chain amino acid transport system substrate-binding protein
MQLLFSEREELAQLMTPTTFNPYRRLPVREREMLFGRSEELAHVYDLLQAETGTIFVRGQKRVGKTSLLLHLEKHYLARTFAVPVFIDFQILGHLTSQTFFYEIANTVYSQLQADYHLSDVGPPLREFFETAPPTGLISYLKSVQSHFGSSKLVLLIDEFSRAIDAYQQHQLGDDFFQQWRGILHATMPHISYVMVVQQQVHDALLEHTKQRTLDPIWHLLEMGETLLLRPLSEKDARQLIERPTYNYLEYSPEALHYVWRLTGGSPFLIQAFCFNLVRYMARGNRRRVEWEDVEKVQLEFMNPNESLFAHLLDMLRGAGQPICRQLTQFIDETDEPVPLTELKNALPDIPAEQFLDAVQELLDRHILIQPRPDACQFTSLLFGRWLVRHTALEQMMSSN